MAHPILMPKAGQSMTEGKIVAWLKKEGDAVARGEPLLEIETDKANLEVEACHGGDIRVTFREATATKRGRDTRHHSLPTLPRLPTEPTSKSKQSCSPAIRWPTPPTHFQCWQFWQRWQSWQW